MGVHSENAGSAGENLNIRQLAGPVSMLRVFTGVISRFPAIGSLPTSHLKSIDPQKTGFHHGAREPLVRDSSWDFEEPG